MSIRTNRALLASLGLALLLWFTTAVVHAVSPTGDATRGVVGLVVPWTPAVALVHGAGGDDVLAAVVFVVVLAGLVHPALHARRTGTAPRVLAVWFAVIVAGGAAAATSTLLVGRGVSVELVDLLATGYGEAARVGCGWGVAYGWIVGLVTVAVARRTEEPVIVDRPAGALAAAITAGAVAAIGWLVVAAAHGVVVDAVLRYTLTPERADLGAFALAAADWTLPVTTTDGSPGAVVLLGGLVCGAVVGTLTWFAARGMALPGGRLVLLLGVWAAAIVGAVIGGLPAGVASILRQPDGDSRWGWRHAELYGPTDGGWSGALYGWVLALLVLGVLTLAQRRAPRATPRTTARRPEPVPV